MNPLARFLSHDWHLHPSAFEPLLLNLLAEHDAPAEPLDRRPTHDANGDEIPQMEITESGLAIVPVHGPLLKGATGSDKYWYGVISHDDVADDLDEALAQGARAILLDINSPGGTVAGTPELAAHLDDVAGAVDVFSYNGRLSASAAEYISVGAAARFGVPSSINGSIGTILTTVDFSRLLERVGIAVNVIASGKYKATGHPAIPLSDDQREYLKSLVKTLGAEFADHVQLHRPQMQAEHFQGQAFTGKQALEIGLLDQLVQSRAEAIRFIG